MNRIRSTRSETKKSTSKLIIVFISLMNISRNHKTSEANECITITVRETNYSSVGTLTNEFAVQVQFLFSEIQIIKRTQF